MQHTIKTARAALRRDLERYQGLPHGMPVEIVLSVEVAELLSKEPTRSLAPDVALVVGALAFHAVALAFLVGAVT